MFLSLTKLGKKSRTSLLMTRMKVFVTSCFLVSLGLLLSSRRAENDLQALETSSDGGLTEDSDVESSLRPPHLEFDSYKKILYFNNYFHLADWR